MIEAGAPLGVRVIVANAFDDEGNAVPEDEIAKRAEEAKADYIAHCPGAVVVVRVVRENWARVVYADGECSCPCHRNMGMHIMACCRRCPTCARNWKKFEGHTCEPRRP